jgi:hypothetical protein
LFELEAPLPDLSDTAEKDGLRLFSLESALIDASPRFFLHHATDARAAMAMIRDASDLLTRLLDGGHNTIAGRLAECPTSSRVFRKPVWRGEVRSTSRLRFSFAKPMPELSWWRSLTRIVRERKWLFRVATRAVI